MIGEAVVLITADPRTKAPSKRRWKQGWKSKLFNSGLTSPKTPALPKEAKSRKRSKRTACSFHKERSSKAKNRKSNSGLELWRHLADKVWTAGSNVFHLIFVCFCIFIVTIVTWVKFRVVLIIKKTRILQNHEYYQSWDESEIKIA